jgi:hypothetical protein
MVIFYSYVSLPEGMLMGSNGKLSETAPFELGVLLMVEVLKI